jgi:UDP-N-acetylmuramoylalanine--D-glutamate ligase
MIPLRPARNDKKLPFDGLANALSGKVRVLVLTGQTADTIRQSVEKLPDKPELVVSESFDTAVREAHSRCRSGDTLLFSPACASYDQFRNFSDRGRRFKELITDSQ